MGWESIRLGGRHEMFLCTDLLNVAQMVVAKWRCSLAPCLGIGRFLAIWHRQWEHYAPGVVDLELGLIYDIEQARTELLGLLNQVEEHLKALGPAIPKEVMRTKFPIPGVAYTGDQETARFLDTVHRLRRLLTPDSSK